MKGKRLYDLVNNLSKSELHKLHRICSQSSDKRHLVLKEILNHKNEEEAFNRYLDATPLFDHLDKVEQDKSVRRFIDFSIKVIEDMLLLQLVRENNTLREAALSEMFFYKNHFTLFQWYAAKATSHAQRIHDYSVENKIITLSLRLKGKHQTKTDFDDVYSLIKRKIAISELQHYDNITSSYNLLSSVVMDDIRLKTEIAAALPEAAEMAKLIESVPMPQYAIQLYLVQARLSFEDKERFYYYLQQAEALLPEIDDSQLDFSRAKRNIFMLKLTVGLHYGQSLESLIPTAEEVVELNARLEFSDTIGWFFLLFLKTMKGELDIVRVQLAEKKSIFFSADNIFYRDFLESLLYYQEGDLGDALEVLQRTVYSSSYYVSMWSKVLECCIHFQLGNKKLVFSLLERIRQYIRANYYKPFTMDSSRKILHFLDLKMSEKTAPGQDDIFILYQLLISQINKTT
jgi:hypothetical protein